MKHNKRVIISRLDEDKIKIKNNFLKNELKEVFLKYKAKYCDPYGNILENNLDTEQLKTVNKLKQRMEEENLVCYATDKTGNLVIDTTDNDSKKMFKHISKDEVISDKKVKRLKMF